MEELEFIKSERLKLQNEYLAQAQRLWVSDLEPIDKDKKVRGLYNGYKTKDKFLENIEAKLVSCLDDINYYLERKA